MKSSSPTHQEISQQAYQIYVRNGCKHGHALEHWLQAETELRDMMAEPAASTPKAANGKAKEEAVPGTPKAANGKAKPETPASPAPPAKARTPGKKAPKSAK